MLKLIYTTAAAAVALGIAAAAHAQPDGKQDYAKSIHKRDHARVNAAELAPQVGNEKWVVLLCRFSNSPTPVPYKAADYDSAFNTHPKSHKNYFKEASYGQLNLTFAIKNWKAIGARSSFPGDYLTNGEAFLLQLFDACTAAYDATTNFAAFDGIAMFFDDREIDLDDATNCDFGDTNCSTDRKIRVNYGMFAVPGKVLDGEGSFRAIWMTNNSQSAHSEVTAHEMNHAYGAPHSGAGTDDVNDSECESGNVDSCGHPWDLMNSAWTSLPTDTHTLAATKVFYHKWITTPRRCNVVTDVTNTEFQLERLAKARDNDRCLAITIKHSVYSDAFGTDVIWYVVEARFPIGFDADSEPSVGGGGVPGPAVIISRICLGGGLNCSITSLGQPVVVGQPTAPGSFQIDEASAEWQAGETFVNFDGKIKVKVVSKGNGFYTVRVSRAESGGLTP